MRIIGGMHRGRKLIAPTGNDIRPTSDRMRETMFNILSHTPTPLADAVVLDAFAGTGALGLEALSRGAAHVTFLDKDRKSLDLVRRNVALLKAEEKTLIKCASLPLLPRTAKKYNFVFLDPPYNLNVIIAVIEALRKCDYLAQNAIIIAEYSAKNTLDIPDYMESMNEKTYGEARFNFMKILS